VTSTIDMNDPLLGFAALDGVRQFHVEAEDIAGNIGQVDLLDVFFDTQGPFISDVFVTGQPGSDLFGDKGDSLSGPTPPVNSLSLKFTDLPRRENGFVYPAVNETQALTPGNYRLLGDRVGIVPVVSVNFIDVPSVLNGTVTSAASPTVFADAALINATIEAGDVIEFASGANSGLQGIVASFDATTGTITLEAALPAMPAVGDTFEVQRQGCTFVELVFAGPLPDDRYTLTVFDNLRDDAGNRLDGEFAGFEGDPFPSGDLVPGGDFVIQFTTDALPELGVWAAGTVLIDANGNLLMNGGFSAGDLAFHLGFSSDDIFAGNFAAPGAVADEFDKLAAYGRVGNQFRWLVDFTNDGVPDSTFAESSINGLPVAGNFDGNAANGDEFGLFTGSTWHFDTDHDFAVGDNASQFAGYQGFPFVGDFDGDGDDDVGVYIASHSGGNLFSIDLNTAGAGGPISIDGVADVTFRVGFAGFGGGTGFNGFPGVRERPVSADMNGDGVDDIGLWVPDGTALVPGDQGEWFFLVSDNDPATVAIENTVLNRVSGGFVSFTPIPFGNDIYAQFGNSFALPVVGNFDPPPGAGGAATLNAPSTSSPTATSGPPSASSTTTSATSAIVRSTTTAPTSAPTVQTPAPPVSSAVTGPTASSTPVSSPRRKSGRGVNTAVANTAAVTSTATVAQTPVVSLPVSAAATTTPAPVSPPPRQTTNTNSAPPSNVGAVTPSAPAEAPVGAPRRKSSRGVNTAVNVSTMATAPPLAPTVQQATSVAAILSSPPTLSATASVILPVAAPVLPAASAALVAASPTLAVPIVASQAMTPLLPAVAVSVELPVLAASFAVAELPATILVVPPTSLVLNSVQVSTGVLTISAPDPLPFADVPDALAGASSRELAHPAMLAAATYESLPAIAGTTARSDASQTATTVSGRSRAVQAARRTPSAATAVLDAAYAAPAGLGMNTSYSLGGQSAALSADADAPPKHDDVDAALESLFSAGRSRRR
jgi:hypothetical protein